MFSLLYGNYSLISMFKKNLQKYYHIKWVTLQATKREEKSVRVRPDKGLIFTMYEELLQINKKKTQESQTK